MLTKLLSNDKNAYDIFTLYLEHQELKIPYYHFDQLIDANGELFIIGFPHTMTHICLKLSIKVK